VHSGNSRKKDDVLSAKDVLFIGLDLLDLNVYADPVDVSRCKSPSAEAL